tara:strand:- start:76 stop:441 length:366 start_codon:yes stop_codon:yes gene_type:complete
LHEIAPNKRFERIIVVVAITWRHTHSKQVIVERADPHRADFALRLKKLGEQREHVKKLASCRGAQAMMERQTQDRLKLVAFFVSAAELDRKVPGANAIDPTFVSLALRAKMRGTEHTTADR